MSDPIDPPVPEPEANAARPRAAERRQGGAPPGFPLTTAAGQVVAGERRSGLDRRALGFLSAIRLLRGVPYHAIEATLAACERRRIVPGEVLLERGADNASLYLVIAGSVHVHLAEPDAGAGIVLGPGECFGEMSVIDGSRPSARVSALAPGELLVVPDHVFWDRLACSTAVSRNLMAMLSERMRRANEAVVRALREEHLLERYRSEMELGRRIQESMLPGRSPMFPEHGELACVAAMHPAREVGGDFFDAFLLDERRVFFVIGDACGKGVPAALLMARTLALMRAEVTRRMDLGKVLGRVNEALCLNNPEAMFVSLFCAILDLRSGELVYANGGHPAPLGSWQGDAYDFLRLPRGAIVGAFETMTFQVRRLRLRPGATLVAYTDGITEAVDSEGVEYGDDRLRALLGALPTAELDQVVAAVCADVRSFCAPAEPQDDMTLLAVRWLG